MDVSNALSVGELNELIKKVLTNALNTKIYVKGEISNIKKYGKGFYFSLKDENSLVSAVCWDKNSDEYHNGEKVVVSGKISCYTKNGIYQLTVYTIDKTGVGELYVKYDQLKKTLEEKSYFSKKREMPSKIKRIGILTSLEGAALQDILYVLRTNNYVGDIYIKNCIVQGSGCPPSVKTGIIYFNQLNINIPFDALIIARGGGSLEDLMGYSTEEVVETIYKSDIFTISAIGHEIDTMLSDYAADFRAPTPSIAGETIIKIQKKEYDLLHGIQEKIQQIKDTINNKIISYTEKLENLEKIHNSFSPKNIIENEISKLEKITVSIRDKILSNLHNMLTEIDKLKYKNSMYDINKIMKSGYVLVTNQNGDLISSTVEFKKELNADSQLKLVFSDGEVNLTEIQKLQSKLTEIQK